MLFKVVKLVDDKDIKIFGKDDEGLKSLGKLLSNQTSRKIMECLKDEPMYINQIAKKLNLQMNLVIHHIKLLEDAKLLTITHKKITRKGEEHKHYKVVSNIFINITETKDTMHEKGFLKRIFRDGIKFASIGIAAIISFTIQNQFTSRNTWSSLYNVDEHYLVFPLLVIIIGLVMERIYIHFKNKKRM